MTEQDIKKFNYCDSYLNKIKVWKDELPFGWQVYGCGSRAPAIEHELESIHREMNKSVNDAINLAQSKVEKIIEEI